jgi:quercetin dioxygenase-like cupin family protein
MEPEIVDLVAQLAMASGNGPVWTHTSEDLNVNLLYFDSGQDVPPHVNDEVDVLIVALDGEGRLELNGTVRVLRQGQACLIPKGASRASKSGGGPFAYLTCHRRRAGLWPT